MTIDTEKLYQEISADEGKVLHCYLCSELHNTVGIGHKVLDSDEESGLKIYGAYDEVPQEEAISEERCYELFEQDVQIAADGCKSLYSNWEQLPQEMRHVLVNMAFQLGKTGLLRFKKMNAAVQDYQYARVAEEMLDSRWARHQTPERAIRLSERVIALIKIEA